MIIGLSGYAETGKDAIGAKLVKNHGYRRVSFADELRAFLLDLNPIVLVDEDDIHMRLDEVVHCLGWDEAKKQSKDVRELLQRLGTECVRARDEDFWVRTAFKDVVTSSENIVITDCRFPNEARAVYHRGGKMVRVDRPGVGPKNDHASEVSLDDWPFDAYIYNDQDLRFLNGKIKRMLEEIGA